MKKLFKSMAIIFLMISKSSFCISQTLDDVVSNGDTVFNKDMYVSYVGSGGCFTTKYGLNIIMNGVDPFCMTSQLGSNSSSGNWINLLPDEDGILVTHLTKDPITIGGIQNSYFTNSIIGLRIQDTIEVASFHRVGNGGFMYLKHQGSTFGNSLRSLATANRTNSLPDEDGMLMVDHGGTNTQSFLSPTTIMVIPHGLSFTPNRIFLNFRSGLPYGITGNVITSTSTNFTIQFSSATVGTMIVDWQAMR